MKTSILFTTALMAMGLVVSLQAQGPPGGKPGMGPGGGRMGGFRFTPAMMEKRVWDTLDKVNLNKGQKEKAKPLVTAYTKRMGDAFAKMKPGDFQGMRTTMMPIRQDFEKKLSKVLTKAQ